MVSRRFCRFDRECGVAGTVLQDRVDRAFCLLLDRSRLRGDEIAGLWKTLSRDVCDCCALVLHCLRMQLWVLGVLVCERKFVVLF